MSIETLSGEQLSAVEFVGDHLQLRFGEALLTLYVWPDVAAGVGKAGFRDGPCSALGEDVTEAEFNEGRSLTVEFENGTVFALSLRDEDLDTPEAGAFTSASGDTTEF